MNCFICNGEIKVSAIDEDGYSHIFSCESCETDIITKKEKIYSKVVKKLTSDNSDYEVPQSLIAAPKLPDKQIELCAMSIVHLVGENMGTSDIIRQSTNDANINETIYTLKRLLSGNFA